MISVYVTGPQHTSNWVQFRIALIPDFKFLEAAAIESGKQNGGAINILIKYLSSR